MFAVCLQNERFVGKSNKNAVCQGADLCRERLLPGHEPVRDLAGLRQEVAAGVLGKGARAVLFF